MTRKNRTTTNKYKRYEFTPIEDWNDGYTHNTTLVKDVVIDSFWYKVQYYLDSKYDKYIPTYQFTSAVGNDRVNKTGKIAKRVSKYLHDMHGIKLDNAEVSAIGNWANEYAEKPAEYVWDFTDDFDWQDGMFGHSGSCWFTDEWDYHASRDILDSAHGYAMRFYEIKGNVDYSNGVGRVWVLPVNGDNQDVVIFNAYGLDISESANILVKLLGDSYTWKKVSLYPGTSRMYVNDDNGVLIYRKDSSLSDSHTIHLGLDEYYGYYYNLVDGESDDYIRCTRCNTRVHIENSYSTDYGDSYCESCYNKLYAYCHHCESDCDRDSSVEFNGYTYCEFCISKVATRCWNCEEWFDSDDMTLDSESDAFCPTCAERHLSHCDSCDEYFYHGKLTPVNYEMICEICLVSFDPDDMPAPRPVVTSNQLPLFDLASL